jgi:hypothetical protein
MTNANVRRIALQPCQRPRGANNPAGANANFAVAVSPTPRTLHELWPDHKFGAGGWKAAKDFTAQERGQVKHERRKRKVAWDKISEIVRGRWTGDCRQPSTKFVSSAEQICASLMLSIE